MPNSEKMIAYGEMLFVKVPRGVGKYIQILEPINDSGAQGLYAWDGSDPLAEVIQLPPGQWEFIGLTNSMGAKEWKKVVEGWEDSDTEHPGTEYQKDYNWTAYRDYVTGDEFDTATESGKSLLTHLQITDNRAALKKVK